MGLNSVQPERESVVSKPAASARLQWSKTLRSVKQPFIFHVPMNSSRVPGVTTIRSWASRLLARFVSASSETIHA